MQSASVSFGTPDKNAIISMVKFFICPNRPKTLIWTSSICPNALKNAIWTRDFCHRGFTQCFTAANSSKPFFHRVPDMGSSFLSRRNRRDRLPQRFEARLRIHPNFFHRVPDMGSPFSSQRIFAARNTRRLRDPVRSAVCRRSATLQARHGMIESER